MKNIHVLPTDKPSRLYLFEERFILGDLVTVTFKNSGAVNQNIYITSDEEIKEGNWYINTFVSEREQKPQTHTEKRHLINHQKDYRFKYCKKIILTTDQDLIKDGVQEIPDDFLKWFVKNPSCEFVEVRFNNRGITGVEKILKTFGEYKIIIPKEEPKQETLEEAIGSYVYKTYINQPLWEIISKAVEFGAKWQEHKMYSEEEVETIAKDAYSMGRKGLLIGVFNKWFEQFKNK